MLAIISKINIFSSHENSLEPSFTIAFILRNYVLHEDKSIVQESSNIKVFKVRKLHLFPTLNPLPFTYIIKNHVCYIYPSDTCFFYHLLHLGDLLKSG